MQTAFDTYPEAVYRTKRKADVRLSCHIGRARQARSPALSAAARHQPAQVSARRRQTRERRRKKPSPPRGWRRTGDTPFQTTDKLATRRHLQISTKKNSKRQALQSPRGHISKPIWQTLSAPFTEPSFGVSRLPKACRPAVASAFPQPDQDPAMPLIRLSGALAAALLLATTLAACGGDSSENPPETGQPQPPQPPAPQLRCAP